jgi:hypothetical protein
VSVLTEARDRLLWLRAEYGEDDIDYATFRPLYDLAVELTIKEEQPDDPHN